MHRSVHWPAAPHHARRQDAHGDGIEVLRRVRQDQPLRTVPVMMLTASAGERDIIKSYRLRGQQLDRQAGAGR
jgi:CheY-like chemotaxis protein